jgi:hypothetical protein
MVIIITTVMIKIQPIMGTGGLLQVPEVVQEQVQEVLPAQELQLSAKNMRHDLVQHGLALLPVQLLLQLPGEQQILLQV